MLQYNPGWLGTKKGKELGGEKIQEEEMDELKKYKVKANGSQAWPGDIERKGFTRKGITIIGYELVPL